MKSKVLKAGVWYTVSNFIVRGLAFITMPIFTRIMSANDIGMFSNITSWFSILCIIATLELYSSVTIARFDYKDDLDSYISSNLFLGSLITIIFYIVVLIFNDFFQRLFSMNFFTINILFIYLIFFPALQMYHVKNRIIYKYKPIIATSIISSIISTAISILLVLLMKDKLLGRVIGYYIPLMILCIFLYIYLMYKGKSISKKYWKYSLMVSIPLALHLLAGTLLSSSDRVMIVKILGLKDNALYSVAYTCSMIISLLWSSMNSAYSPWAFEKMNEKKYDELKEKSKPYFMFFLIISLLFMIFAPEILYIMGGNKYISAKYVIPPVMLGYIFQFVYSFYVNIEYYNKKQIYIAIGTIIAALTNIILNLIFIPCLGYIAAAYTTLIGYILMYIIHFYIVHKLGYSNWYDNKYFIKLLILFTFIMLIMNIMYMYYLIRYLIIIILLSFIIKVLIINKKMIKKIIKTKSINGIDTFRWR